MTRKRGAGPIMVVSKNQSGYTGVAWLVRRGREYFIISGTTAYGTCETLVFRATKDGKIKDYSEVWGVRGNPSAHQEAIHALAAGGE